MRKKLLLLVLLSSSALAATYQMADLKALEAQQSWGELVEHLDDIVPSKRDPEWKALAERSTTALLGTLEFKDGRTAQYALDQIEHFLKRWPWLKQSKTFLAKRAEVGLKAFGYTFGSSPHTTREDPWRDSLKEFVATDTLTADLPLRAGRLMMGRLVADNAMPYFKSALATSGKPLCKDPDLQKALLTSWQESSWTQDATAMTDTCWEELKPLLLADLAKAGYSARKNSLCPYLLGKKAITAQLKPKCTFD